MTREEIRELAAFQADESKGASALTFYFQPVPPQDRSHRSETIVAKDAVKEALKSAAAQNKNGSVHADLDRVLEFATNLRGQSRGRAVFACSAQNIWKEYELPPRLGTTRIYLQPRFQLKPLAALLGAQPALCVAVVDRQRARFFDLRLDDLREGSSIVHLLSRSAASYGYNGYEAGHAERRVAEEALQHFKAVAERLRTDFEKGVWERLIIGCHDVNWPEFEPELHPYIKQRIIGRFSADVASVSNEEIRDHANFELNKWIVERGSTRVNEAIGFAKANSRGVTGLRRVLAGAGGGRGAESFHERKLCGACRRVPALWPSQRAPGADLRSVRTRHARTQRRVRRHYSDGYSSRYRTVLPEGQRGTGSRREHRGALALPLGSEQDGEDAGGGVGASHKAKVRLTK